MIPLNICLMTSVFDCSCATGRIFLNYANTFAARGHAVKLFFHRRPTCVEPVQARVVVRTYPRWVPTLPGSPAFNPVEILMRMVDVVRNRYDIIHVLPGHRPSHLFPALLARRLHRTVLVDEWWEWFGREGLGARLKGIRAPIGWYEQAMELWAKQFYDAVLPISHGLVERLPPALRAKCTVLHGGMDTRRLVAYDLCAARRSVSLPKDLLLVGMSNLCTVDHDDNIVFLEGFAKAVREFGCLRLVASGDRQYIASVILPLVGRSSVVNVGWQPMDGYNRYFSACDVFALPFPDTKRNRGRWPNRLGDYVWLRRPVITNPTGDLLAIFREHRVGYVCEHAATAYADAIAAIHGHWTRGDLAVVVPDKSGLISIDERMDRILKIYESLIERREATRAAAKGAAIAQ